MALSCRLLARCGRGRGGPDDHHDRLDDDNNDDDDHDDDQSGGLEIGTPPSASGLIGAIRVYRVTAWRASYERGRSSCSDRTNCT